MKFGDFQKENREAVGMRIYRLKKLTEISRAQLANYEESKSEPTIKNAEIICNALSVAFIIGNGEVKTSKSNF